jgi:hypothetical protein
MKNLIRTSNILQVILFLSFFLPFFKSCDTDVSKQKEMEEELLKSKIDSTQLMDSTNIVIDSTQNNVLINNPSAIEKLRIPDQKASSNLTDSLCKNNRTIATLLRPNNDYSGMGYILDYFKFYFLQFGILSTFILLLLSLIIRLVSFRKFILPCLILNTSGLIFLILTNPFTTLFEEVILWGYITSIVIFAFSIVLDIILFIKLRNINKPADNGHTT